MALNFDNFMNHRRSFDYISNVVKIDLGGGYSYTSKPISPQLRKLTLSFQGFKYYFNSDGTLDYETNKNKNNIGALCQFYESVNEYQTFIYNDVQFGAMAVRFAEPIKIPSPIVRGNGAVEPFTITLQEVAQ